jgi:sugar/nucleoside kinase (ribokinase family)
MVESPTDPTGCGDVFGAAVFARLLAGDSLPEAIAAGNRAGARNVSYRGASGLASHLRGELVAP